MTTGPTRRGFLQGLAALVTTTAVIRRAPMDLVPAPEILDAEIIEDDEIVPQRRGDGPTKLELYLKSRGIKPAHLARESGYSRQHLLRIRLGRMDPSRRCIAAITLACRRLAREHVVAAQLFDLG